MFSLLLLPSAALAWAPAPGLVLSSIFFSIWRKFGRSFKHLWRDVRPPCRPTSWLCLFSWFSSIRDQVCWPAYDHDHEWLNFFEMLTCRDLFCDSHVSSKCSELKFFFGTFTLWSVIRITPELTLKFQPKDPAQTHHNYFFHLSIFLSQNQVSLKSTISVNV